MKKLTRGQRAADIASRIVGSWAFLIAQAIVITVWIGVNVASFFHHWDPYPFLLLNICLSFQAAFSTPMILIAQNRQDALDRGIAKKALHLDLQNHEFNEKLHAHLVHQDEMLEEIRERLNKNVKR